LPEAPTGAFGVYGSRKNFLIIPVLEKLTLLIPGMWIKHLNLLWRLEASLPRLFQVPERYNNRIR
jgi:hypothetical protein